MAAAFFSASAFRAVGLAVGVDLPAQVWCAIVPLFSLFGLLPLSVSGFGGAQAVHVFLLAPFAVAAPQAFAVSALYAVLNILLNVVFGAVAWMIGSNEITKRAIATDADG
jgi:glycosyltransferase 2 family protein